MRVYRAKYHRETWEKRGGTWLIECMNCQGFGEEFDRGYPTLGDAQRAASDHVCNPLAVEDRLERLGYV